MNIRLCRAGIASDNGVCIVMDLVLAGFAAYHLPFLMTMVILKYQEFLVLSA